MTSKFMTEPVKILVKRDELTLEVCFFLCFCMLVHVYFYSRLTLIFFIGYLFVYNLFRESNNFLLLLRRKSGNLIHSVIFMTRLLSLKLLSSAILNER